LDSELNRRLASELKILNSEREIYAKRLALCEEYSSFRLRKTCRKSGKYYFYAKGKGSSKFVYIGPKGSPDVKRICEAHFLKEAIRRIDVNISIINSFTKDYLATDHSSINESLPSTYRSDTIPASLDYQREGALWKKQRLSFQSEFPENYPEYKTETASDGVRIKTISEVVLYERLKAAGLYVIYELPLVLHDYGPPMYPDFTILSPIDMKTEIIVEYVGRLDLPKYRDDFARRVNRYISNGFKPGVNLFFIYSDANGHIDSLQINRLISDIRGI
jgi:hypothetical protein